MTFRNALSVGANGYRSYKISTECDIVKCWSLDHSDGICLTWISHCVSGERSKTTEEPQARGQIFHSNHTQVYNMNTLQFVLQVIHGQILRLGHGKNLPMIGRFEGSKTASVLGMTSENADPSHDTTSLRYRVAEPIR